MAMANEIETETPDIQAEAARLKAELLHTQQRELDSLKAESVQLKLGLLRTQIGQQMGLPSHLLGRIQGDDQPAIEADCRKLLALFKAANDAPVAPTVPEKPIYTRKQLRHDPKLAASPEVKQAMREGRVVNG